MCKNMVAQEACASHSSTVRPMQPRVGVAPGRARGLQPPTGTCYSPHWKVKKDSSIKFLAFIVPF